MVAILRAEYQWLQIHRFHERPQGIELRNLALLKQQARVLQMLQRLLVSLPIHLYQLLCQQHLIVGVNGGQNHIAAGGAIALFAKAAKEFGHLQCAANLARLIQRLLDVDCCGKRIDIAYPKGRLLSGDGIREKENRTLYVADVQRIGRNVRQRVRNGLAHSGARCIIIGFGNENIFVALQGQCNGLLQRQWLLCQERLRPQDREYDQQQSNKWSIISNPDIHRLLLLLSNPL
ncbi:MAG: hypothetical protein Q9P14_13770 [candidate division KSB1 bacterium]|nr:hypothetical protein [candidate division KSB1 bacterium]